MYVLDTNVFRWHNRGVFVTAMGWMRKRIRGSKVENVHKRYANRLITASVSKKYTNGLHHVGGVQKGGNIGSFDGQYLKK